MRTRFPTRQETPPVQVEDGSLTGYRLDDLFINRLVGKGPVIWSHKQIDLELSLLQLISYRFMVAKHPHIYQCHGRRGHHRFAWATLLPLEIAAVYIFRRMYCEYTVFVQYSHLHTPIIIVRQSKLLAATREDKGTQPAPVVSDKPMSMCSVLELFSNFVQDWTSYILQCPLTPFVLPFSNTNANATKCTIVCSSFRAKKMS